MATIATAQPVTRDKRTRLIKAAQVAFYQQGVAPTTLADIAALAEVPLGNVYYYFRTKDDLLAAVIEAHLQEIRARFAQWDQDPQPRQRLLAWLQSEREGQLVLARYGCPYGSLGQELGKTEAPALALVAQLLEVHIAWAADQVRQLGKEPTEARELAVSLVAALQGAFLLSCSFRSPALLDRQVQRLHDWMRSPALSAREPAGVAPQTVTDSSLNRSEGVGSDDSTAIRVRVPSTIDFVPAPAAGPAPPEDARSSILGRD